MDQNYTKREEDTYRQTVLDTLTRIETQTTKTNGRVTKLENRDQYIKGAIAIIVIVLLPIIFILVNNYILK